jgi:hypothetical protein
MRNNKYGNWPKTEQELLDYLHSIEEKPHDYNSIAQSLADVTVAMFNYFASKHGMTGFQVGWAGLQIIKMTRGLEAPFGIIDGSRLLYPQYDIKEQVDEWIEEWKPEIGKIAKQKLAEADNQVHPNVINRWKELSVYADVES